MRSLVVAIVGHLDAGKTTIVDQLRGNSSSEGDVEYAQSLAATVFNNQVLARNVSVALAGHNEASVEPMSLNVMLPGLVILDTPGMAAFEVFRSRAMALADVVVVVVDMFDDEPKPQTLEVIRKLQSLGKRFVIALNKVDRLSGWTTRPNASFRSSLKSQSNEVVRLYKDHIGRWKNTFQTLGLNTSVFWNNSQSIANTVYCEDDEISLCPLSARSGEGIPDLFMTLTRMGQEGLSNELQSNDEVNASILEVSKIDGMGFAMDILLRNGGIKSGDKLWIATWDRTKREPVLNPLQITVRSVSIARLQKPFKFDASPSGAAGTTIVRVFAKDSTHLQYAMSGSPVISNDTNENRNKVQNWIENNAPLYRFDDHGIVVHAPTYGALECLIHMVRASSVPLYQANIGNVDLTVISTIIARNNGNESFHRYKHVFAFAVNVEQKALDNAAKDNVKICQKILFKEILNDFEVSFLSQMMNETVFSKTLNSSNASSSASVGASLSNSTNNNNNDNNKSKRNEKSNKETNDANNSNNSNNGGTAVVRSFPCELRVQSDSFSIKSLNAYMAVTVFDGRLTKHTPLAFFDENSEMFVHFASVAEIQQHNEAVESIGKGAQAVVKLALVNKNAANLLANYLSKNENCSLVSFLPKMEMESDLSKAENHLLRRLQGLSFKN